MLTACLHGAVCHIYYLAGPSDSRVIGPSFQKKWLCTEKADDLPEVTRLPGALSQDPLPCSVIQMLLFLPSQTPPHGAGQWRPRSCHRSGEVQPSSPVPHQLPQGRHSSLLAFLSHIIVVSSATALFALAPNLVLPGRPEPSILRSPVVCSRSHFGTADSLV